MITLLEYDALASTSTTAQELLDAGGAKPPFAVRADRQTAGRGRRGNHWESPAGNLYMTVVLPPGPVASQSLAPLKAALLTAEYVQAAAGVRLTVKWPNDLLFAGRKVGGFLLESSLRGHEAGATLVGIGLNLAHAPALAPPARAAALAQITGASTDVRAFARGLAQHLADAWTRADDAGFLRVFADYALPDGSIWQSADDARLLRRSAGVDAGGALRLTPLAAAEPVERLTSIDHKFHWIYQGEHAAGHPLLVADVGNSSTKLAFLSPAPAEKVAPSAGFADGDEPALAAALERYAGALAAKAWPIYALSVSPRRLQGLSELAERAGLRVLTLPKRPVRRRDGAYPLAELGIDRLALIEAWLAGRAGAGGDGVIVSAGTATTIDIVRADGTHAGGFILAGMQTSLDALHAATGLLPALTLRAEAPTTIDVVRADGTRPAMLNGAVLAAVGAVEHIVGAWPGTELVLTGGLAPLLAPHFPRARLAPDLSLRGAQILALGGVLPEQT